MLTARAATRVAGALALLLGLGACQNLYIASDTSAGIQASLNTARTAGKMSIGWERDFIVMIPRSVKVNSDEDGKADDKNRKNKSSSAQKNHLNKEMETMSVASCTDFDTEGVYITKFEQRLATGEAARNLMETMRSNGVSIFQMGCFGSHSTPEGQ